MSILAQILQDKVLEVASAKAEVPLSALEARAAGQAEARDFAAALRRPAGQPLRVIAEFKRASPSAGAIRANAQPEELAPLYQDGGASAISVLTDQKYFDGHLDFLERVKACSSLPVLRKDFLIDPYQVLEGRAHGADAVLLIVSALDVAQLKELYAATRELGMRALVEVHDEREAERAVGIGAEIIGVNHRNLATFEIDLGLTGRLAALVDPKCILVGESGIRGPEDMQALGRAGAHAVLVGQSLMEADDPAAALRALRTVQ